MLNNVIIYSKANCPYCDRAKILLRLKNKQYQEMKIGEDLTRDDFVSIFPNVKSVPHIIINGDEIGGFDKLTEWFDTDAGRDFLAE
jgi:glutaredoxin 3